MLREIKNREFHYFVDSLGNIQGVCKSLYPNGNRCGHRHYVNGIPHGETKSWGKNGKLYTHRYLANGELVHDFLESPLTDEEKMLLVLKYGGKLLPKED